MCSHQDFVSWQTTSLATLLTQKHLSEASMTGWRTLRSALIRVPSALPETPLMPTGHVSRRIANLHKLCGQRLTAAHAT